MHLKNNFRYILYYLNGDGITGVYQNPYLILTPDVSVLKRVIFFNKSLLTQIRDVWNTFLYVMVYVTRPE